jgi:putative membrane protein
MARPFLNDEAKRALTGAVEAVEAGSSAELVVAVRDHSGSYLHAALLGGVLVALATLVVLLFSPWPFDLVWFVVDPLLLGLLAGFLTSRSPVLCRLLTSRAERRRRVETAARSLFVEKRVHGTTGRTGLLLYISILEREAELVVDLGVETLAGTEAWRRAVADVQEAVRRGDDGIAVAGKVHGLAAVLSPVLARQVGDVDELANEVCE